MVYTFGTLKRLYHLLFLVILLLMFVVIRLTESMCGTPGYTKNCDFKPVKREYQDGETVTYDCKYYPCYAPNHMRRSCLENGSWSGTIPFCYKRSAMDDIHQLSLISGKSRMNANSTMDRINTTCITTNIASNTYWEATLQKPFRVIAAKILFSDRIAEFSTSLQILDENGAISYCESRTNQEGTLYLFECSQGVIGYKIKILPIGAQMSDEFKICEVFLFLQSIPGSNCIRPDMPYQSRGIRKINPSLFVMTCNENYEPVGNGSVICKEDGSWTPSSFKCQKRIGCEKLPEVANGVLRYNSTTANSTARLECNDGFRPLSDSVAYCLETGKWTTLSFNCEMIKCEETPKIPHGKAILPSGYFYGSRMHITCDRGYMAVEPTLRECLKNGSWGNLNICTRTICGSLNFEDMDVEEWVSLNETISIRVLICQTGYHIEGSPAVTRCLSNGSWSHTTAACRKTPNFDTLNNEWTTNTVLLSAVAVGAGTAICILSLAMCFLALKKRQQKSSNSSVFHVGVNDSILYQERSEEQPNYKTNTNENSIELRNNPSSTKPRKPSSALPHLPIFLVDTDPVYAQPFETSTTYSKIMPVSTSADLYTAHIYAEPVDSHSSPSGPGTFTSVAETWLKSGAKKFGRKMSLPGRTPFPDDLVPQLSKTNDIVHKPVNENSGNSSLNRRFDEKQKIADYEPKTQIKFSELINNSIYLDTKEGRFTSKKDTEQLQMIDNDIYQDDYFSNV